MRALGIVRSTHSRKEGLGEIRVAWGPISDGRLGLANPHDRVLALKRRYLFTLEDRISLLLAALQIGILRARVHARLVAGAAGAGVYVVRIVGATGMGRSYCAPTHQRLCVSLLSICDATR